MIGTIEFEAGGKPCKMRLSTNAQIRYQRATGKTFLAGLAEMQQDPGNTDQLRTLVWASLSDMEGMTEEGAGEVMDDLGLPGVTEKLAQAVAAAYPKSSTPGNGRRTPARPKK